MISEDRKANVSKVLYILGLGWIILAAVTIAQGTAADQDEFRSLDEHVKIMDFQIPGWQQKEKPVVRPIVKNNETEVTIITTWFWSGMRTINVELIIPGRDNVYKIMTDVPKEDAKQLRVDGFGAIQIAPPSNPFTEYKSVLYINVADRYVVRLEGTEVLEPETLINAAKAIDLKKLATLPR